MTIDTIMHPADARPSAAQLKAGLTATVAVAETIRELREVPSGTLYARLCDRMDLTTYEAMIGVLKRAGLVSEAAHVLRWIGPEIESDLERSRR